MTPPAKGGRPLLPALALLCCVLGLLGLYLPLVEQSVNSRSLAGLKGVLDEIDLSVAAVPVVGILLTILFLSLSVLPVMDLARRRVHVTGWLTAPAAIGLLPMVPFAWATFTLADASEAISLLVPEDVFVVGVGAGAVLLLLAEFGLIVLGPMAIVARFDNRGGGPAPPPPPPVTPHQPRSPYL